LQKKGFAMTDLPVVLVVGSLHHDIVIETPHLPRVDETAVGRRWYPKFGGKGGNQAVAAQAAGVRARMFGAVGKDGFGTFLTKALDQGGVDRRFLQVIGVAGSGMSVAVVEDSGDYAATIVSGANLHLDAAALEQEGLWQDVAVLVLQNEIPEAVNLAAARAARVRGLPVILNAAPARKLPDALNGLVDVLIVNAVEAQMMGSAAVVDLPSAEAAALQLRTDYRYVIVTAGAKGLAAVSEETGAFTLPARRVKAISTHGAGDCFTGTLAAALARGAGLREACFAASEAAADHVARPVQGMGA
jgi:ribokinase